MPTVCLMLYPQYALCYALSMPYAMPTVCLMLCPQYALCYALTMPYAMPTVCLMLCPRYASCYTHSMPYAMPTVCLSVCPRYALCFPPFLPPYSPLPHLYCHPYPPRTFQNHPNILFVDRGNEGCYKIQLHTRKATYIDLPKDRRPNQYIYIYRLRLKKLRQRDQNLHTAKTLSEWQLGITHI